MRKIYYYVPKCPACGSRKTGRYIKTPISNARHIKESATKAGELIRFASDEPINNAFCTSCGHEWATRIQVRFLSPDEVAREKRCRGISGDYDRMILGRYESKKKKKGLFSSLFSSREDLYEKEDVESVQNTEFEIIDARKKKSLTLLYADEEMLRKVRKMSYDTV